jgi:hypothetical protein
MCDVSTICTDMKHIPRTPNGFIITLLTVLIVPQALTCIVLAYLGIFDISSFPIITIVEIICVLVMLALIGLDIV